MAPDADLLFYKIGDDIYGDSTDAAQIHALNDAVSRGADAISMSYGGFDPFKDGSDAVSQASDNAYAAGAALFYSAGNEGDTGHHYQGTVAGNSETAYIELWFVLLLELLDYICESYLAQNFCHPNFYIVPFFCLGNNQNKTLLSTDAVALVA